VWVAEQPPGFDQQDGDHDQEYLDAGEEGDERRHETLQHADEQRTDDGTLEAPQAADDDDDERRDDDRLSQAEVDALVGPEGDAADPGERHAEPEQQRVVAVDVDAEVADHLPVL